MIQGELETLERYVHDLEALRHYGQVKVERDSLATEAAQLKEKVGELTARVEREVSGGEELSSQLSKKESEVNELAHKVDELRGQLAELQNFRAKVPAGSGFTLEQLKEQFLHAEEGEIEVKVKERLEKLETQMHSHMPAMVRKELSLMLEGSNWPPETEKVVRNHARTIADEQLGNKERWPDWFTKQYIGEVQAAVAKRLDLEFERRVGVAAQKRLDDMKAGQWQQYITAKSKGLAASLRALVRELQGIRWFTCDRCRRRLPVEIGPYQIGDLLAAKTVDIMCSACLDQAPPPFFLSSVPHKVTALTLGDLLQFYLGEAPATNIG